MTESKNYILNSEVAAKKLERMAYEILENNMDEQKLVFAGIRDRGSAIARRMQQYFGAISEIPVEVIRVDLEKIKPDKVVLSKEMDFDNAVVILMDDVASSGETLTFALKPFLRFHPKKIQTLVLVERSHKMFPIHSDYVGLSIASTLQDHIFVEVEGDEVTGAYLV